MSSTRTIPARIPAVGLALGLLVAFAPLGGAVASARPQLTVRPATVEAGDDVSFSGSGFLANRQVQILIGPPRSEASPVGSARAGRRGHFRVQIRLSTRARPGRYVALACQRSCRIKASANLRIRAHSRRATAASRAPTKSEAAAIRRAAQRSLHGSGWKVSAIRVSTARTKHRYAKAAVDNRATGVGGEMILWRDAGRWQRIFLGTNDFCDANAPKRVLNDFGFGC